VTTEFNDNMVNEVRVSRMKHTCDLQHQSQLW